MLFSYIFNLPLLGNNIIMLDDIFVWQILNTQPFGDT